MYPSDLKWSPGPLSHVRECCSRGPRIFPEIRCCIERANPGVAAHGHATDASYSSLAPAEGHTLSPCEARLPLAMFKFRQSRFCRAETAALNTGLQSQVFKRRKPPALTVHLFLKERRELCPRLMTLVQNAERRGQFLYRLFRVSTVVGRHQDKSLRALENSCSHPPKKSATIGAFPVPSWCCDPFVYAVTASRPAKVISGVASRASASFTARSKL